MKAQRGAALLAAMLTVTLVASFAATALWQQWRAVEIESAERSRVQAAWILTGALDWARLILREDARSGGADHLAEPWAVALQEARLSSFLAADKNSSASDSADNQLDVFLSGQIEDMQSRLNVINLIIPASLTDAGKVSEPDLLAFARLFELLDLPQSELLNLAENLRLASDQRPDSPSSAPLMPRRLEQLAWLGLSQASLARLRPYISLLFDINLQPARTPVNLNTASAEVIYASIPGLEMAQAQRLVDERARSHFRKLTDAGQFIGELAASVTAGRHSVATRFFEVRARLRMERTLIEERSLLQRDGLNVRTLWRERAALPPPPTTAATEAQPLQ
ncbi:MAG: type II secretion system minor pseudopilin GspK [Polaromonas sp.]|nr:type II secretion system minor pseudopilin GspK [Polaromonas sp.]